jgi:hypothetical protein
VAAPHVSAFLSVSDAKIAPLLTDPAGGPATYGDWIDLPDVTNVSLEGDTDTKVRRGDGVIRDQRLILTGLTLTVENTALPLDVLAALEGGTVVDSGSLAAEIATYTYAKDSSSGYVKFEAQCTDVSEGLADAHLIIYKAKLNNKIPVGFTDDDFQTYSYELGAVARNADDAYYSIVFNETLTAIDPA